MFKLRLLVCGVLFGAAVAACTANVEGDGDAIAERECRQDSECSGGKICLPIGACAAGCTDDASCGSNSRCSTGGGCVSAENGCGGSLDCGPTEYCGAAGACVADSVAAPGSGAVSTGNGGSLPARECGAQKFAAKPVDANFFIVLDHSGSMDDNAGNAKKWDSAVAAVRSITQQHQATINFGLQMFSFPQPRCDAGRINLDVGPNQAAAISALLPANADGQMTPIAGALAVAATAPGLKDKTRSNNVLLITDGIENCNGNPVARTQDLFNAGIRTYVVGFGAEVNGTNLSEMALAGGTSRPGGTKYYQADDAASLNQAFGQIAQGALGCDLALDNKPPNPFKVFVYVDGAQQPRDGNRQNGWDYDATTNRVSLYGSTCNLVTNNANAKVDIIYGCPDETLVETPGTGSTNPNTPGVSGGNGLPAGSSCKTGNQCASGQCGGDKCEGSVIGTPCSSNGQCETGVCNAGFCEGPGAGTARPGGAVCGANNQCQSTSCNAGFCEGGSLPGGAACSGNNQCASNRCDAGFCGSTGFDKPAGAACTSDLECASDNCERGFCEAPGSGGGKPNGSACASSPECLSGNCQGGVCREGGIF